MYRIFMNGLLYKITNSKKCLDSIVDRFVNNHIKGQTLRVENSKGELLYEIDHF